jgi:non-ribosomal peptide synthetase component F
MPAMSFGYADYVAWRVRRDRARADADLSWWTEHLRGAPAALDLPRDRPRQPVQSFRGSSTGVALGERLDRSLRDLAGSLGATPSLVVLAGLAQALRRLSGSTDLVIGAIVADRGLAATQDIVGFFVDIVPLRIRVRDTASFAAEVRSVAAEFLAATAHPAAPLERIVETLRLPREPGQAPLVQVVFNAYTFAPPRLDLPGVESEPLPVPVPGAPVELTVYLIERAGGLALDLRYDSDLYDGDRVGALGGDLVALLADLVAHPDRPVGQAPTRFRTDGVTAHPPAAGQRREAVTARRERDEPAAPGPVTPTERLVAGIWGSVLEVPVARATENFFDLGGSSFSLVEIQARLSRALGWAVPVVDLFRFPSVRALAAHLDGRAQDSELIRAARLVASQRARNRRRRHHER